MAVRLPLLLSAVLMLAVARPVRAQVPEVAPPARARAGAESARPAADDAAKPAKEAAKEAAKTSLSSGTAVAKLQPAGTFVSVVKEGRQRQTLIVNYRWPVFTQASVEVRLVPGDTKGEMGFMPLYFVKEHYNGDLRQKVFRCLDESATRSRTETHSKELAPVNVKDKETVKEKLDFTILGQRNFMGHSSVMVVTKRHGATPDPQPVAVFPVLADWAINDNTLALELPRADFAKPGKIYVWFLRGERVVWEEADDWPGYPAQGETGARTNR
jgi:hypothetical protein